MSLLRDLPRQFVESAKNCLGNGRICSPEYPRDSAKVSKVAAAEACNLSRNIGPGSSVSEIPGQGRDEAVVVTGTFGDAASQLGLPW